MPNPDIQIALTEIAKDRKHREKLSAYYDGDQALAFATEKFRNTFGQMLQSMRDNLCPIVVDSPVDRMEIINFSGDETNVTTADAAWKLWQNSQMELTSAETHTEALKTGSAFIIVWPDTTGKSKFYLQNSLNCAVISDPETQEPVFGAKLWLTVEEKYRLNLYYADRIEKLSTQKKSTGIGQLKASEFLPFKGDGDDTMPNPYGVVPMFKFETRPVLNDAIPIQDALNKTVCDKLVAMEFAAFRQRWATGLEVPTNEVTGKQELPFKAGADKLWFTDEKDAKFGDFDAANLEQFLKVADSYRLEMARVSGTPLHFFSIQTGNAVSGEALKTLESRFTKKVTRLTLSFGPIWANVMQLALKIEGNATADNLTTQWQSPEHRSENEFITTLGLKRDVLDIPVDTLREEAGYSVEQIAEFNVAANIVTVPDANEPPPTVGISAKA